MIEALAIGQVFNHSSFYKGIWQKNITYTNYAYAIHTLSKVEPNEYNNWNWKWYIENVTLESKTNLIKIVCF